MKNRITALAIILATTLSCQKQTTPKAVPNKNETPIEKLVSGNKRFLDEKSIHPHQNKQTVLANQDAQHPFAVILTCSDSRVSPEILFDQGIGDLFVIRNAGNLISDIDMGSIEYAVEHLDTKLIVVLGHTECGAVKAYVGDKNNEYKKHLSHIDDIVATIADENEEKQISKEDLNACVIANIQHSLKMIQENPIVKEKHVKVVPMQYDIHTGKSLTL
ncbi:carbonic anhydrase [Flavobacterium fluvii]|uniref:Carbonic anhydrase n=1 Tax=Flavobacterium fluvii TaxID=468056 RepID=A0A1M5IG93_9FLAO|nr:carbonic anhydrase [Flavobacterium fluvii]SHG26803.1 carbonic anhydrase [Flavobacterium fluvii]